MNVAVARNAPAIAARPRVRVMIVDDAVVVRGFFARWIEAENDLELVASLRTGREAVERIEQANPDVVVLDVEMPDLDGITALPLLLAKKRDLVVIMASTITRRNAEISLRALSLGAADYVPKPTSNREVITSSGFRRELIEKVRQLGLRAKRFRVAPPLAPLAETGRHAARLGVRGGGPREIALRPMPLTPPRVLLIGSSTGGPQALNTVLPQIDRVLDRAPVLITQHMPPTFTAILAEHLSRAVNRPVREAADGEPVSAGAIYIAPGGKHMRVERGDRAPVIALDDGAPVNFCKPAVDPLFSSAAAIWGRKVMGVVLTGMGADGLSGARAIVAAGGHILAQDEATSVVWGMPGQVAHAGLCSAVLPLGGIGATLTRLLAGERP